MCLKDVFGVIDLVRLECACCNNHRQRYSVIVDESTGGWFATEHAEGTEREGESGELLGVAGVLESARNDPWCEDLLHLSHKDCYLRKY